MTSLLRQIVAGPRAKHAETGLDLCYVTSNIIATSGPSQTYPQRAYRNPLDQLVAFLNAKHGDCWAIWEFRAEGTGYPDEAVYGRIRHYPWPDHHPPPFRLVPMIMASMRQWLNNEERKRESSEERAATSPRGKNGAGKGKDKNDRVVVVHCKAGKGRSGTMACSYLIAECGWRPEDALARFTERRMRPSFGAGVSIPSQLRWVSYVNRWTKGGKKYFDREIEILELHVWGLRHGVKVSVEGFVNEGKKIRAFHTFTRDERIVVEGDAPGGSGVFELVSDMAGYGIGVAKADAHLDETSYDDVVGGPEAGEGGKPTSGSNSPSPTPSRSASKRLKKALSKRLSPRSGSSHSLSKLGPKDKSKTITMPASSVDGSDMSLPVNGDPKDQLPTSQSQTSLKPATTFASSSEPGGQAVILKPSEPIRIPNNDVNISVERRNRAPVTMGLTMVTSVAHVWFNTFFEGNGPEQDGRPDDSGIFEIEWDKMDGIKGSSQKGTRACDRLSVVWQAVGAESHPTQAPAATSATQAAVEPIREPGKDSPVPDMKPADWKGGNREDSGGAKQLGLRAEDPESAGVSRASSIKSEALASDSNGKAKPTEKDDGDLQGVKTSGPSGEEIVDEAESHGKAA